MKKLNTLGTSLIEALVVLFLVTTATVGIYKIYSESNKLTESSQHRLEAIQIAREGIEAVANIRDTNWLRLAADPDNCWNALNYDISCVGGGTQDSNIEEGSYIVYQKTPINNNNNKQTDYKWYLYNKNNNNNNFSDTEYRKEFGVFIDENKYYNQKTQKLDDSEVNKTNFFTREIQIKYLDPAATTPKTKIPKTKMKVTSIVQWADTSLNQIRKVELSQEITNWKKKK